MPNMNNVIQKYNYTITKSPAPSTTKTCNCRRKTDCSMDITVFLNALFTKHLLLQLLINIFMVLVKILSKNVTITTINVLLEKNLFEKNTELSKYVWELKKRDANYLINWDIAMKSQNYVCGSRKCDLCTCVKVLIARADLNVFLNKPDDLILR